MSAADLLATLARSGVIVTRNDSGGIHIGGSRPSDDALAEIRAHRAAIIAYLCAEPGCTEPRRQGARMCEPHLRAFIVAEMRKWNASVRRARPP